MARCVSYAKSTGSLRDLFRSCRASPYADWSANRRRRPSVVVFQHARHWIESDMYIYFQPRERRIRVYLQLDYYAFDMTATLAIDVVGRTIGIDHIWCESRNHWPGINGSASPPTSSGGIAVYKKNLQYLMPGYDVSLDNVAALFFGDDWKALPLPLTRPRLADDAVCTHADMMRFFDDYTYGPWHATIGKFVPDEDASAVVIQKCFRGWRARRVHRFDPHTTLGRYYALRMFRDVSI